MSACVRACVRAAVRACVRAAVRVFVNRCFNTELTILNDKVTAINKYYTKDKIISVTRKLLEGYIAHTFYRHYLIYMLNYHKLA